MRRIVWGAIAVLVWGLLLAEMVFFVGVGVMC